MEYTNYIFDLYGTLIDVRTDEQAARTWKRWCKKLDTRGIMHPEYYRMRKDFFAMDKRYREVAKAEGVFEVPEIDVIDVYRELFSIYGNGVLSDELLNDISYEFRVASRDYIRLFPGVREYLLLLRKNGKHTYILSNAQRSYTWPEIEMFELQSLTDAQLISSDEKVMKPDKKFFEILLSKYSMEKNETLMHGDSAWSDIGGAKAAGIDSVHLCDENAANVYYTKKINEIKKAMK